MSFFCPYTTCPILQNERLQRPFALLRTDDIEKPQTNADCIRQMSDEELARLFGVWVADCENNDVPCRKYCDDYKSCGDTWLAWLRDEVTE